MIDECGVRAEAPRTQCSDREFVISMPNADQLALLHINNQVPKSAISYRLSKLYVLSYNYIHILYVH